MKKHSTGHDSILGHVLWYNKSKCLKCHHFQLAENEEFFCTFFYLKEHIESPADIRHTSINRGADFCKNLYLFWNSTARSITFSFFFIFVLFLVTVLLSLRRGLARYCKHKTLKAASLFILGNYRLCIPAHVVENKLMNRVFSVNCYFYEWIERTCVIMMFSNSNTFSIYVIIYSIEPNFLQTSHLYYFVSIFPAF